MQSFGYDTLKSQITLTYGFFLVLDPLVYVRPSTFFVLFTTKWSKTAWNLRMSHSKYVCMQQRRGWSLCRRRKVLQTEEGPVGGGEDETKFSLFLKLNWRY